MGFSTWSCVSVNGRHHRLARHRLAGHRLFQGNVYRTGQAETEAFWQQIATRVHFGRWLRAVAVYAPLSNSGTIG